MVVFPYPFSNLITRIVYCAQPMHHTIIKPPLINLSIIPHKAALSIQKIILKLALIHPKPGPKNPIANLASFLKPALKDLQLLPLLPLRIDSPPSLHNSIGKCSNVFFSIWPIVCALAIF